MDTTRKWIVLSLLAAMVVLGGGWVLLVSPERQEAADLRDQALMAQAANAQQRTRVEVLKVKAAALPAKKAEIAAVAARIPAEPELPDLLRSLSAAARSAGVELVSVAPGSPTPVAPAVAGDPAPAAPAPAAPAPAAGQAEPASVAPGTLSTVPIAMVVHGQYFAVEQFVAELEDLRRALRLSALTLAPGSGQSAAGVAEIAGGKSLTSTITAQVYVSGSAPNAPAAPAAPSTPVVVGTAPAAAPETGAVPGEEEVR